MRPTLTLMTLPMALNSASSTAFTTASRSRCRGAGSGTCVHTRRVVADGDAEEKGTPHSRTTRTQGLDIFLVQLAARFVRCSLPLL